MLFVIAMFSCTKSTSTPSGSNNGNGAGGGNTGNPSSTLTYVNDTYTPISITINNVTQTISVGSSLIIPGDAGKTVTGTAYTSGQSASGSALGLKLSWNINNSFPNSGNVSTNLDAGPNYFFLNVINNSSLPMTVLYVNYGLQPQTTDNITIPNDGRTYNIGYYNAYTNSNVRTENGSIYWYWPNLNLPGTINQSTTVTGD